MPPVNLINSSAPLDHLTLKGAADAVALQIGADRWSYAQLERLVGLCAGLLRERGLQPGDRVALWSGKSLLACVAPLACARAGLVYVPINPALKRAQVSHILKDSGARLLLTGVARAGTLTGGDVPQHCHLVDDAGFAAAVNAGNTAMGPSAAPADALAAILYTSGSTGKPKGVMLSHANLMLGAEAVASYLQITPQDRVLAVLPLSFDYGQNQLFSTWFAGGCVVPLDYLLPAEVVRAIERHEITTLAGVPPLWVQLLEARWSEQARQSVRRITNSGGALTRRLISGLRELLPQARIFAMYGLTEAFRSTYLDPQLLDAHPESIGTAIPHAEVLVVRADGTEAMAGEPGELVHCGPLVAQGYWQDAEKTALRFRPAPAISRYGGTAVWSGDTVVRDEQGLLTFVGRDDSMIKSSGNRISPTEIEEAAEATGLVAESVAFGLPDVAAGQLVALVVRPLAPSGSADAPADELRDKLTQALRSELPSFMQPRHIVVRADLPRNANGKLDRVAIVATAQAELTS